MGRISSVWVEETVLACDEAYINFQDLLPALSLKYSVSACNRINSTVLMIYRFCWVETSYVQTLFFNFSVLKFKNTKGTVIYKLSDLLFVTLCDV